MNSVISRRIFLEGRIYEKIPPQRFLYLFYIKKWPKVSWIMCVTTIYHTLWSFVFIIGGIIKRYSYFLVPYIVAENPNFSASEAITLSRKMMNGHKWECFLMEFSYLGWFILRVITLGLSGLFYSNSYKIATYTEFYVEMRQQAIENKIPGAEKLNDIYLYEKAAQSVLNEKYADIVTIMEEPKVEEPKDKKLIEKIANTN